MCQQLTLDKTEDTNHYYLRIFAAWNVHKRQQLIEQWQFMVFEAEADALDLLTLLSWKMPLTVFSTSVLDTLLMVLYQRWLHPWRMILAKVSALQPLPDSWNTLACVSVTKNLRLSHTHSCTGQHSYTDRLSTRKG